jgi:hypothetical protein
MLSCSRESFLAPLSSRTSPKMARPPYNSGIAHDPEIS